MCIKHRLKWGCDILHGDETWYRLKLGVSLHHVLARPPTDVDQIGGEQAFMGMGEKPFVWLRGDDSYISVCSVCFTVHITTVY